MPRTVLLRRFFAFRVVAIGGGAIGCRLNLGRFLGGTEVSGAVVSGLFHIVVFGERRDEHRSSSNLADALEDNFGAAVVEFHGAADFNGAAGETANVTDIFQVGRKDYDGEGAGHLIFAEVEEVNAPCPDFYAQDFAGHALGFANVLARFADGEAVGGGEKRGWEHDRQQYGCSSGTARRRASPGRTAPSAPLRAGLGGCPHQSIAESRHSSILGRTGGAELNPGK
jgi:hypothetical protein